jgi:XTP/dITP diphosphohydrolase
MTSAPRTLWIATTNAGKLRDFALAADNRVQLLPLPGVSAIKAPAEDEVTFEGNARVKAIYYSKFAPGEIVVADDSGLEVDELDGRPGVRSARYAEDMRYTMPNEASLDARNNACLLSALRGVPGHQRQARYRCVLAAARDGEVICEGSGVVEGVILSKPRGEGGFGYDPLFVPDGEMGSMSELDPERRMRLSHRGRALADLISKLALRF